MSTNYNWQATHPIHNVPIAVTQSTSNPTIRCDIRQAHNLPTRSWAIHITTWINTNYFLWCACAGLANYRSDQQWTDTFNAHYRSTWDEIQARVGEIDAPYRFSIPIPPPPAMNAIVIHHPETGPDETFRICPEPRSTCLASQGMTLSRDSVWPLLRFVTERGGSVPDHFDIILHMEKVSR